MEYMKGGDYNLSAFQKALTDAGGITPATVIVYTSVVRTALRRMPDTSPESVKAYLGIVRDRSFPSAWRSFVEYARGRGRFIGDLPQVSRGGHVLVEPWSLYPVREAYATLLQVAMLCYWDLSQPITLYVIDLAGSAMRRSGRNTWRNLTGEVTDGHIYTGEQKALRDALRWGRDIAPEHVTGEMDNLTLFPRTPRCNEQLTVSEMAGVALGAHNRALAERIAKAFKLHLPPFETVTVAPVEPAL